jgi:hypothetical protein
MRPAKGFLADDGTFFDTADQAELYDALAALTFHVTQAGADPKKALIIIDACAEHVRRYLDAKEAYNKAENANVDELAKNWHGTKQDYADRVYPGRDWKPVDNGRWAQRATSPAPLDINHAEFFRAETDVAPVQQQSIDEPQHVPDVGSGVSTEAIQDEQPVHGIGSGIGAPRGFLRDAYMAGASSAAITRPRRNDSETIVRATEGGKTIP